MSKSLLSKLILAAATSCGMIAPLSFAADFYNLPVCRSNGDQSAPVIIADGSGGAFILWLDGRSAQRKIYCQRLNTLGQPQWQADGLEIAKTSGQHAQFSACATSQGLAIAWQEATGSDDGDIYAQLLDYNGVRLWGEGGKEIYRGNREQTVPMIIAAGSGTTLIVWQDERGGTWDIFAQRVNANGDKQWNPAGVALIQESRNQLLGDIAIAGQGLGVAWRDERTTPNRVLAQRFDFNGNKVWNDAVWVAQSPTDQSQPQLSVTGSDLSFYVAWIDRRLNISNVYVQRLSALGVLQWGTLGLAAAKTSDAQSEMQLLEDREGGVFLVWEDARADKGDIYAQHLNREGQQLWSPAGLALMKAGQGQYRPRAVNDEAGGLICAWEEDRGSGANIAAQRVDASGNLLWLAEGVMLTNHGEKTFEPVILNRVAGRAFVAWIDTRNPNDDVYGQALAADGKFENVPPAITSIAPTLAYANTEYNYTVTSTDFDSGELPELALTSAPAWLQLDQTAKALHGMPGAIDLGEFQIEIQAGDAEGGSTLQSFTLQVLPDPAVPKITSKPDTVTNEDAPYRYQLQVRDPDPQESLQYRLETAAAWLALSAQGVLSGTPLNEHVGSHAVKITVTNRKGKSDQQQFDLRVANTNDPPRIISAPPPRAYEGVPYSYQLEGADIDQADSLSFMATRKPAWLQVSENGNLSGMPARTNPADTLLVVYVRDRADSRAEKTYAIPVSSLGEPDVVAPPSPRSLAIAPANWSRISNFTVQWQNPFDPSGIAGAFYKIGAAPDSNRDGVLTSPPTGQTIQEIKLQAGRGGKIPVYVWLVDGRGNLDYKTALRVDYRYDSAAPRSATNLRAGNTSGWVNQDTIQFSWQAASDSLSGVARQDLIIAGKTIRRLSASTTTFALDTVLTERRFSWNITAVDSAGNLAASVPASFGVDRTPPAITHVPIDTVEAGQPLTVRTAAHDQFAGIAEARVLYRTAGASDFTATAMSAGSGEFVATLGGAAIQSPGLQYVILVTDSAGNAGRSTGNSNVAAVHAAVVSTQQIFSRQATRGEYYELVSVPYRLSRPAPGDIFTDNFGAYDPLRWRLYAYAPQAGNIEFGKTEFQQIMPGRAYWLITAKPQNFDAGAGVSFSTTQAFNLELQSGWNLIATPFDFPTNWATVQKPPAVESQLWGFDGKQYVPNGDLMQPWQGYFVRNLSDQPQTLVMPPPCANCVSSLPKSSSATAPVPSIIAKESFSWRMQLLVRAGEFADTQNWLGVSNLAQEEWDRLELSEPPPAAGEFVGLRFPQGHWKKFHGEFTTDFRPAAAGVQKWIFEIYAAHAGKALSLSFQRTGTGADNWSILLQNENEDWVRPIDFDEDGRSQTFSLRSGETPRRFVLWAGAPADLDKAGLLANAVPQAFSLAPSYPNPARLPARSQAVSTMRFSLPIDTQVDLLICDLLGRPVRTLLQKAHFNAGHHEILWNGRNDIDQTVAAGVYFCRMQAGQFNAIQKIILLR